MSIKVMSLVFENSIDPTPKFVLVALADHASDDGSNAFPSVATIERKTGFSRRRVQRGLRDLEQDNWISLEHVEQTLQGRRGMRKSRTYRINVTKLKNAIARAPSRSQRHPCQPDTPARAINDTDPRQNEPDTRVSMTPKPSLTIIEPSGAEYGDGTTEALSAPSVSEQGRGAWQGVLQQLTAKIGGDKARSWINDLVLADYSFDEVVLIAKNQFKADYVRSQFQADLSGLFGCPVIISTSDTRRATSR